MVLFVVILAFLVGRVRAGADPGLARETTQTPKTQAPQTQAPQTQPPTQVDPSVDPNDPFADPQQSADPPSTHVS